MSIRHISNINGRRFLIIDSSYTISDPPAAAAAATTEAAAVVVTIAALVPATAVILAKTEPTAVISKAVLDQ